jgi:ribonuclease HI
MVGLEEQLPKGTTLWPGVALVHFDGACQPPRGGGVSAYGFTIEGALEHDDHGLAVPPGAPHSTNNVAEYVAAIAALEWLRGRGFKGVVVLHGDSQLVIRQMTGEYEVRVEHLKAYHQHLRRLTEEFAEVRFVWIPRSENERADTLSKVAIEEHSAARRRRPDRGLPDEEPSRGSRR